MMKQALLPPIGQRTVEARDIAEFASLTGDASPVHVDAVFARAAGFPGPIAHGLLTASWALGALAGAGLAPVLGKGSAGRRSSFSVRLARVVVAGDVLTVRGQSEPEANAATDLAAPSVMFQVTNQRDEVVCSGHVTGVGAGQGADGEGNRLPIRLDANQVALAAPIDVYYAEDILECGPRGVGPLPARSPDTEAAFVAHVSAFEGGAGAAVRASASSEVLQPMQLFCDGFSKFLVDLLSVDMPATGSAGHVGDEWKFYRPVLKHDVLTLAHVPLTCVASRSQPGQAIVRFGLQWTNQRDEIVLDGVVAMMIPSRPNSTAT